MDWWWLRYGQYVISFILYSRTLQIYGQGCACLSDFWILTSLVDSSIIEYFDCNMSAMTFLSWDWIFERSIQRWYPSVSHIPYNLQARVFYTNFKDNYEKTLKGSNMKKIVGLLWILTKYYLKITNQDGLSFSISCLVLEILRWYHMLFAYFKTVNIWITRQIIEKLKMPCWAISIRSTEIKTRQTIFHDTAPLNLRNNEMGQGWCLCRPVFRILPCRHKCVFKCLHFRKSKNALPLIHLRSHYLHFRSVFVCSH